MKTDLEILKQGVCLLRGHKRGKRIAIIGGGPGSRLLSDPVKYEYRCPRCGATWTRKAPTIRG